MNSRSNERPRDPDKREAIQELLEKLNISSPEELDEAINRIRQQFI